jgi:hypothetical protein
VCSVVLWISKYLVNFSFKISIILCVKKHKSSHPFRTQKGICVKVNIFGLKMIMMVKSRKNAFESQVTD